MKRVIVTGAASGIGLAVTERFLKEGYRVWGMSRRECAPISHPNFTYLSGDITAKEDREKLVNAPDRIDILVNAAGVAPTKRADLLEMSEESYDRVMEINLKGTVFLTQLAAKRMIEHASGHICSISSLSAYTSSTSRGEYCISKAGLSMMTKLFADRLSEYNITVNEIRAGIIATDMTSGVKEKYDTLIDGGLLPIHRWGTPQDIAEAVFALCSGSLPYVTGQSLDVDGGFHIRRL